MSNELLLDRALYKKVKSMDRAEMEQAFRNMYQTGYDAAMNNSSASTIDLDALRTDLSLIKGVGDKRLDEIMSIIEIHLIKSCKTE